MSVYEIKENIYDKQAVILRCDCTSDTHQLEFSYWINNSPDEFDFDELFIGVTLKKQFSFFRRLIVAFRYLFGWPGKFEAYEESLFSRNDVEHLMDFLDKYLEYNKKHAKSLRTGV